MSKPNIGRITRPALAFGMAATLLSGCAVFEQVVEGFSDLVDRNDEGPFFAYAINRPVGQGPDLIRVGSMNPEGKAVLVNSFEITPAFEEDFDLRVFNGGRYLWVESGPDFEFLRDEAIYDMITGIRMFAPNNDTDAFAIEFCGGAELRDRRVALATEFLSSGTGIEPMIINEGILAEAEARRMEGETPEGQIVYTTLGTFRYFVDFRSVETGDPARLVFADPDDPNFAVSYGLELQSDGTWQPRRCNLGEPDLAGRTLSGAQVFVEDGRIMTTDGPLRLAESELVLESAAVAAADGPVR